LHATGSVMTAAISDPCSAKSFSTAFASFQGANEKVVRGILHLPERTRDAVRWRRASQRSCVWFVAEEHRVHPAVVMTLELHDVRTAGEGARQPQCNLNRLAAARCKRLALGARDMLCSILGQMKLQFVLRTVDVRPLSLRSHGFYQSGVTMP